MELTCHWYLYYTLGQVLEISSRQEKSSAKTPDRHVLRLPRQNAVRSAFNWCGTLSTAMILLMKLLGLKNWKRPCSRGLMCIIPLDLENVASTWFGVKGGGQAMLRFSATQLIVCPNETFHACSLGEYICCCQIKLDFSELYPAAILLVGVITPNLSRWPSRVW